MEDFQYIPDFVDYVSQLDIAGPKYLTYTKEEKFVFCLGV